MQERLQKFISQAGVASRRRAEELIVAGKVKVNGKVVSKLGTKINPEKDQITVNSKQITVSRLIYLALNKPKRCLTTRHDPQRRRTIYDLLPAELKNKVWPVGRLDFDTEGLLLLTNDGELTQRLTHPGSEHEKEYEVILDKPISEPRLEKIRTGVVIEGKQTAPAQARVSGHTVYLTIHEGWKRQIRKMFAVFGYTVRNLKRIRVGRLKLGNLPPGQYKIVDKSDVV